MLNYSRDISINIQKTLIDFLSIKNNDITISLFNLSSLIRLYLILFIIVFKMLFISHVTSMIDRFLNDFSTCYLKTII